MPDQPALAAAAAMGMTLMVETKMKVGGGRAAWGGERWLRVGGAGDETSSTRAAAAATFVGRRASYLHARGQKRG